MTDCSKVSMHFSIINDCPPDQERVNVYQRLKWKVKHVSLKDLGVWDKAHGMPHLWCVGNVVETARRFQASSIIRKYHEKIRILKSFVPDVVLDTIIVVDGRLRRGRENCNMTKYSIDDGCMRAISYAVRGRKSMKAYVGTL